MASINVLKGLKARKTKAPPKKRKVQTAAQVVRINRNDPFELLVGITNVELLYDAMEAAKERENLQNIDMPRLIQRVRKYLPIALIDMYFKKCRETGDVESAFQYITKEYPGGVQLMEVMKDFIKLRTPRTLPYNPPTALEIERRKKAERVGVQERPKRASVYTKYSKANLKNATMEVLDELLRKENIQLPKQLFKATKQEKIAALVSLEQPRVPLTERRYEPALEITRCESEYKNAPWVPELQVVGMALLQDDSFATDSRVVQGWYHAKASWYKHVCENGREYVPGTVSYVLQNGSVVTETIEMYEASLSYIPERAPIGLGKAAVPRYVPGVAAIREEEEEVASPPSYSSRFSGGQVDPPSPVSIIEDKEVVDKELAPGLFIHVRNIIRGTSLACVSCGLAMAIPAMKSMHKRKNVYFCSRKCFDDYPFSE